jgi:hypothetical protein
MIMSRAANFPETMRCGIKRGAAWPAFWAVLLASPAASDNLPQPQNRSGFHARDHVVIRREIRLGDIHLLQGAAGIITTVRHKGRLLDVQFAGAALTLHHLDLSPAPSLPAEQLGGRARAMPGRKALLARPDNPVHPNHLLRGKPQLRVGGV